MGRTQMTQDKGIKAEFKQQRVYMDTRFSYMDRQFSEQRVLLSEMATKSELAKEIYELRISLERRFHNLEARMLNFRATRPGAPISVLGRLERGGTEEGFILPNPLPRTVKDFWRLKKAQNREHFLTRPYFTLTDHKHAQSAH